MNVTPITLSEGRIRLEPLTVEHVCALREAAADGALWQRRVTSVPEPKDTADYVQRALAAQAQGHQLPFAVIRIGEAGTERLVGTTRYHDIVPEIDRLEIGYTWYAQSAQRTHVNTCAKQLLLTHAFDALGCQLVGWRTDVLNLASQSAIERLGAHKDGILRHHALRRDGSVRDTVIYSLTAAEWPPVRARLAALASR